MLNRSLWMITIGLFTILALAATVQGDTVSNLLRNGDFEEGPADASWVGGSIISVTMSGSEYVNSGLFSAGVDYSITQTINGSQVLLYETITNINFAVFPNEVRILKVKIDAGLNHFEHLMDLTSAPAAWTNGSVSVNMNISPGDSVTISFIAFESLGTPRRPAAPFTEFALDNVVLISAVIGGELTPTPIPTTTPMETPTEMETPTPTQTPGTTLTPTLGVSATPTPTPVVCPAELQVWANPDFLEVEEDGIAAGRYFSTINIIVRDNLGGLSKTVESGDISVVKQTGPGQIAGEPQKISSGFFMVGYVPTYESGTSQIKVSVNTDDCTGKPRTLEAFTYILVNAVPKGENLIVGERPLERHTLYFRGLR